MSRSLNQAENVLRGAPPLTAVDLERGSGLRRYSLAHLTLLDIPPPEFVELAARAGYDHVGLRIMPLGLPGEPSYDLSKNPGLRQRTRRALKASGITVLDVELARILPNADVSRYSASLEIAAELGARHVLCSAWCPGDAFVLDQFMRLCEIARPLGLRIEFEFVTFADWATLHQAAWLLRAAGCDNAGLCIDTLHFDRSGHRPDDLDDLPGEWFAMAQICDGPVAWSHETAELKRVAREARVLVGQGGIDVHEILLHMPRVPCSLELPNGRLRSVYGPEEFARRCLDSARVALEKPMKRLSSNVA